jgi:dephospho-CoA kinase
MITFKEFISESINDAGLLKAVFVIGLPGAGKSYTIEQLKGTISPKIVNTDKATEFLSIKYQTFISSANWNEFKDTTHRITQEALRGYINGMLPLFIDGTSNNVSNILHRIGILESLGYDIGIVFVHASLETSKRRADARTAASKRVVDEEFIELVHKENKENAAFLKNKVDFFRQIENGSDGLDDAEMLAAFKAVQAFFAAPLKNPVGKRTLETLKDTKQKYLVPALIPADALTKKIDGWYKS